MIILVRRAFPEESHPDSGRLRSPALELSEAKRDVGFASGRAYDREAHVNGITCR